jgi:hypothetical protein
MLEHNKGKSGFPHLECLAEWTTRQSVASAGQLVLDGSNRDNNANMWNPPTTGWRYLSALDLQTRSI